MYQFVYWKKVVDTYDIGSNKINKIPYFKGFFIINFIKKMVIFHVFHLFHGNFMVIFANKK